MKQEESTLGSWPAKFRPWQREKLIGHLAPYPVDERLGFARQLRWSIDPTWHPMFIQCNPDAPRVGYIEQRGRYLGNGGWRKLNRIPE